MRRLPVTAAIVLATSLVATAAHAEGNTVEPSFAAVVEVPLTLTHLLPPACAGLTPTTLVLADTATGGGGTGGGGTGGGGGGRGGGRGGPGGGGGALQAPVLGTRGPDLILGSTRDDALDGLGGDDCIVSGPGLDTVTGGAGADVCVADVDDLVDCETLVLPL